MKTRKMFSFLNWDVLIMRKQLPGKPLNVLGTPSCRQAMHKQAAAMASLLRPFRLFCSWTCLNSVLALSYIQKRENIRLYTGDKKHILHVTSTNSKLVRLTIIFLGKFMRSAIAEISLNAVIRLRSEPDA